MAIKRKIQNAQEALGNLIYGINSLRSLIPEGALTMPIASQLNKNEETKCSSELGEIPSGISSLRSLIPEGALTMPIASQLNKNEETKCSSELG